MMGSGVVRGQAQCGTYVPVCTPWSGQGSVCGVARIAPTKNIAQGLEGGKKKANFQLNEQ